MRSETIAASFLLVLVTAAHCSAVPITTAGNPAQLDVRPAGGQSVRVTLRPVDSAEEAPYTPALVDREAVEPVIRLREIDGAVEQRVGSLTVTVSAAPLTVAVRSAEGRPVQTVIFGDDGALSFDLDDHPVLGLGEGGPLPKGDWRTQPVEFDRRGRLHRMRPRWQADCYGSRNPVALLVGTSGWALWVATPWGEVDLSDPERGRFAPWNPPEREEHVDLGLDDRDQRRRRYRARTQGRPPVDGVTPGVVDLFVFDTRDPTVFMKDLSGLTGKAALPPKWALGYLQSHRTLEDDDQMVRIVDTFREKRIPLDGVIYLGTGFCPRGWNTRQPSLTFNPQVFRSDPADVIERLHERDVKVALHVVPWGRDRLTAIEGEIAPHGAEPIEESPLDRYWREHEPLVAAGVDAWWPDEGDWYDLFERVHRHRLYHEGPLSTTPNERPWSLHRNGYLGIAKWGGWVWSGDTESAWKTLEAQIAVGVNHSLSVGPFWGTDIGGFFPSEELTGELYARWFQFGAFCPSFRSHGRTWQTRLPWGWGLEDLGPIEHPHNPRPEELNNPAIEPICRRYAELRYQLLPYVYTLAWEARETGLPMMRALWLHHPDDAIAQATGDQYLWGRDLMVAPVYEKGATSRDVYLPEGDWYDFWTGQRHTGGRVVRRPVDLATLPLYTRAGAIVPLDPVRQHSGEAVDDPTTLRVWRGADGAFTLYEDDGHTLEYLDGAATVTRFTWDDAESVLSIEPQTERTRRGALRIEVVPTGESRRIELTGESMSVRFGEVP